MSKIQLFENISEIGAGTRGSSLGVEALKIAAFNSNSMFFKKFKTNKILNKNEAKFFISDCCIPHSWKTVEYWNNKLYLKMIT